MEKQTPNHVYSLISNKPLTEFDQAVLTALNGVAASGYTPRAGIAVLLTEEGDALTYHFNNTVQDLMVEKGYMEAELQREYALENLPFYVEQAVKDGLLGDEWDDEEEEDSDP